MYSPVFFVSFRLKRSTRKETKKGWITFCGDCRVSINMFFKLTPACNSSVTLFLTMDAGKRTQSKFAALWIISRTTDLRRRAQTTKRQNRIKVQPNATRTTTYKCWIAGVSNKIVQGPQWLQTRSSGLTPNPDLEGSDRAF